MKGLLAAKGIKAGQRQIAAVLPAVNPTYHRMRQTRTARQVNPIPYNADYFGHKIHADQNEKLVMFGVTHVLAIDGYSRRIVSFASMPIKNSIEIYKHVFRCVLHYYFMSSVLHRPAFISYGVWDTIRVDHGREFFLSLYVQEKLSHLRTNAARVPYLQTTSKQV